MTKQSYILVSLFIAILLLALMLGCSFMIKSSKQANAEYIDIITDNNALVNFNQQYDFNSYNTSGSTGGLDYTRNNNQFTINGTNSSTTWIGTFNFNAVIGHTYYFYVNVSTPDIQLLLENNNINIFLSTTPIIYTNNTYNAFTTYLRFNARTYTNATAQFYCIDLSLMFGNDNLPNLQQCQDLFVADYYPYNTGTPVSINGLSSYAQGYANALGSNEAVYSNTLLSSMVFANVGKLWNVSGGISIGTEPDSNFGYGEFAFRFPTTMLQGDSVSLTAVSIEYGYDQNTVPSTTYNYTYIGYYDNGSFISIASFDDSNSTFRGSYMNDGWYFYNYGASSVSFTLPKNLDAIYFRCQTYNDLMGLNINVHSNNTALAVDNSYKDGYSNAENTYIQLLESYYGTDGTGGSNYEAIWNEAYNVGLNDNVSNARKKTYTFTAFLGALFDVPVSTIKSLLDFNFLGFNLKNFVFSLLTLSIVFALIKLILVKTGDGK